MGAQERSGEGGDLATMKRWEEWVCLDQCAIAGESSDGTTHRLRASWSQKSAEPTPQRNNRAHAVGFYVANLCATLSIQTSSPAWEQHNVRADRRRNKQGEEEEGILPQRAMLPSPCASTGTIAPASQCSVLADDKGVCAGRARLTCLYRWPRTAENPLPSFTLCILTPIHSWHSIKRLVSPRPGSMG